MLKKIDNSLFLALVALFGIGLVQVYSSSYMLGADSVGDGLYFFKRQMLFTLLSLSVLVGVTFIPWKYVEKYGWLTWLLGGIGVAMTFIPGIGVKVGGASRWLQLPLGLRFEPSELLKVSFGFLFGMLLVRREELFNSYKWISRLLLFAIPLLLLLKQPDFGSFAIIILVGFSLMFAFGMQLKFLGVTLLTVIPAFYFLVMQVPYRRMRVLAFLDPWSDQAHKGFQVIQSMMSFGKGGMFGVGLGESQSKLFFLPEAHTDFTLAVFGEEMGFIGFVGLLIIYGFIVFKGFQIAFQASNPFKKALALGVILNFAFSVFINAGVVMGLLPTKGLTFPFLSYGGSSLLVIAFAFGILLNIDRSQYEEVRRKSYGQ